MVDFVALFWLHFKNLRLCATPGWFKYSTVKKDIPRLKSHFGPTIKNGTEWHILTQMEQQLHFQLQNLCQDVISRWFLIVGPTLHFFLSHECFFIVAGAAKIANLCQRFNVVTLNQRWFWRCPIWEWQSSPCPLAIGHGLPAPPADFGDSTGATAIFFYQIRVRFLFIHHDIPLYMDIYGPFSGEIPQFGELCRGWKDERKDWCCSNQAMADTKKIEQ